MCDGVEDDIEINQAIQALSIDGGKILLLDGTYYTQHTININKNNVTFEGMGNSTRLMTNVYSDNGKAAINVTAKDIQIKNIYLSDIGTTNPSNLGWDGIILSQSSSNVLIDNCTITNYTDCLYLYGDMPYITNCHILANKSSSNVAIYGSGSGNRQFIINCFIEDSGDGSFLTNTMLINCFINLRKLYIYNQVKVLNNYFFQTSLINDGEPTNCTESIISNNYFLGNNTQVLVGMYNGTVYSPDEYTADWEEVIVEKKLENI